METPLTNQVSNAVPLAVSLEETQPMECARCDGYGVVAYEGTWSGHPSSCPEPTCPECNGTGEAVTS